MELKVNSVEVYKTFGQVKLMLTIDGRVSDSQLEKLSDTRRPWRCKFVRWQKKRSLDANAYAWVLMDLIAGELNRVNADSGEASPVSPVEIYRDAIRDIPGNHDVVCVPNQAVKKLTSVWCSRGLGWQVLTEPSKIKGCTNATLYYGSSVYTAEQMGLLLNKLGQDCRALGISTDTDEQMQARLKDWEG